MELYKQSAIDTIKLLKSEEITPLDCLDEMSKRIQNVDNSVNALPTLCFERAYKKARQLMQKNIDERGCLFGLPVTIKDLMDVSGVRCTSGSPIFKDRIAEKSDILVENIEQKGGVVYAMSNTPEFGAGANTFNEVFGKTLNPWDLTKSVAGSSGGAAAALATGMAWLAHGSDFGGSLRNPASFCSVVGMRPSPGRVASNPSGILNQTLGVNGPMARNILDLALFFDAMIGETTKDPVSIPIPNRSFLSHAKERRKPLKVAISQDLGLPPVDQVIREKILEVGKILERQGIIVEEAAPNLSQAPFVSKTLRAFSFYVNLKSQYIENKNKLKPEIIWNIDQGKSLTVDDLEKAQNGRVNLYREMQNFFDDYDLLLCPSTIVPPFPVEERYLKSCDGVKFFNYIEWLNIVSAVKLTSSPALSIPCGFTSDGLPIGLQIISKFKDEANLLSGAAYIEENIGFKNPVPINPLI